jgi:hypothetical protein
MARNDNSNLLDLDIVLRLPQPRDFARELQTQLGSSVSAGLLQATKDYEKAQLRASEAVDKKLAAMALKNMRRGLGTEEIGKIASSYGEIAAARTEAAIKIKMLEEKIAAATSAADRSRFGQELDHAKALYSMRDKEARREYGNILKYSLESSSKYVETLESAFKDGVVGGLEQVKSGDIAGFTQTIAGGLKGAFSKSASILAGRAEAARAAGSTGKAAGLDKIAGALGGLAKGAMLFAGVAAAAAALLALIGQVDEQFKAMNKTFIETAGGAELLGGNFVDVTTSLAAIRDVVTDFGLNSELGTTAEELNALAGTFARFGSRNEVLDSMDNLRESLTLVTTYARLTGESMESMGTSMSEYGERMRMSLSDVAGAFSNVLDSAVNSGIGVNRFQSFVFQATANTALYNKRLEETASLLTNLSRYVDFETATKAITDAGSRYEGMSVQERLQSVLTTNNAATSNIFRNDLRSAIADLGDEQGAKISAALTEAMAAQGLSTEGGMEGMLNTLAGANARTRRAVQASPGMREHNMPLLRLLALTQGAQGGDRNQAMNLDMLSNTGALTYQMVEGRQAIGAGSIDQMSMEQIMAAAQTSGMTPEAYRRMMSIEPIIRGEYEAMQGYVESGDTAQLEQMGLSLMDGQAVPLGGGPAIGSFQDFIMNRGVPEMEQEMTVAEDIQLMRQIATNTQSFGDIIQNGVTSLLQDIYTVLAPFINTASTWLTRMLSGGENGSATSLTERISGTRDNLTRQREELRDALNQAREQRSGLGSDADPEMVQHLESLINTYSGRLDANQTLLSNLGSVRSEEDFQRFAGTDVMREELARRQALAGNGFEFGNPLGIGSFAQSLADIMDPREAILRQDREDAVTSMEEQIALAESGLSVQQDELTALNRITEELEQAERSRKQQELRDFLMSSGLNFADAMTNITMGNYDAFSPEHRAILDSLGIPALGTSVDDFIYQSTPSGSRITPIHSEDQFYGAKPGGPIANAANNNSQSVVVNIYGASTSDVVRTMDTYLNAKGIRANRPLGRKM